MHGKLIIQLNKSMKLVVSRAVDYYFLREMENLGFEKLPTLFTRYETHKEERKISKYLALESRYDKYKKSIKGRSVKITPLFANSLVYILIDSYNNKIISKDNLDKILQRIGKSFYVYTKNKSKSWFMSRFNREGLSNLFLLLIEI